jgi:hypothetical protein
MLEAGDVLETWALAQLPRAWQAAHLRTVATHPHCPPLSDGNTIPADKLPDHRLAYLDYEGPVSGGRGEVVRAANGSYAATARRDGVAQIDLSGELNGRITLARTSAESGPWVLAHS